ncbi:rRNA methyltransferase [Nocardiopsis sp. HNM0947]|uniref:rRNA methyltransferase n=1 Tax=Nocardiopsis coralli TaxID=2772213 RepID=A0ABR9PBK9_9ACTN|nr:TrmH family RNA methyltransferase [Nocardiopsis coralli]MBE3001222.1 rRNA methyltransferase [Nocardiopsis coralli]
MTRSRPSRDRRPSGPAGDKRVTTRNATFQQWETLLHNRTKRHRAGAILVQGVRPISMAVEAGWTVRSWLYRSEGRLSEWAQEMLRSVRATRYAVADELMRELGDKEEPPELLAEIETPEDDLSRIRVGPDFLGVVLDRPTSPGNIGSVVRSVDALGGSAVIVGGHAADPYDPKAVRASTGSLFGVPVVRAPSAREVLAWVEQVRAGGVPLRVVATDEEGAAELAEHDLRGPTLVLTGNETTGLSNRWREEADDLVYIPMGGTASSLNAASATTVVLYEASRQRRGGRGPA